MASHWKYIVSQSSSFNITRIFFKCWLIKTAFCFQNYRFFMCSIVYDHSTRWISINIRRWHSLVYACTLLDFVTKGERFIWLNELLFLITGPPELPYFLDQSYHQIADDFNDTLNLIEGESSDFGCRVPNVFPTPDVNIYVNKVKSQKLEDVTPNFLITEEQNIRCTENVGMKACPLHVSYDMLVVNKDFKPTYEHDEQTLTCSATMRQFSRDGQKIQIKMNVECG